MTPATFRRPPPGPALRAMVLALAVCAGGPAPCAEAALYEAEVAWTERDEADRSGAFRRALRQVLVRLTGRRDFAEAAQMEALLEPAPGLVQQYQLRTVAVEYGDTTLQEPRLWVRFDETAVDRFASEAGLSGWSGHRPPVLGWIAAERDGTLRAIGAEGTGETAGVLQRVAESRGVSLILPLLDLEDRILAGPPELWVESEERIRAASERYRPGSVLIGRIDGSALREARWSLLFPGGGARDWRTEGDVLEIMVDEGVQEAIDAVAAHHLSSVAGTRRPAIEVSVSGVHDFMGYARTMRYLESLDEVESVDVLAVVSGRLRLGLKLRTGVAGLRELLALGATLSEDVGNVEGALALRLLP